MRILIIGGSSSLAHALRPVLSEFAEVITAGRTGSDVHLDLSEPLDEMELPKDIDVVINTAAHFGGKDYEQMYLAESINVLGTLKLCQVCSKAKVRHLVNISSTSAYLGAASDYYGIYALSKRQADEVLQLFCSSFNLPCTILRPSQLYGNEDMFRKHQPFLYTAIDKAERAEDITIYGTNDALRNYIHIDDFTKIISLIVRERVEGLYVCTNAIDVSLSQIANAAIDAFCSASRVVFLRDMEIIQDNVFPYDDSLYKKIKYFPQIFMEEGVKRIAAYRISKS
jgi:nucleoside-diphosphate-sugar epimerase